MTQRSDTPIVMVTAISDQDVQAAIARMQALAYAKRPKTPMRCPLCGLDRVDCGESNAPEYRGGIWIGCTACGLSVSGPRPAAVRIAWAAIVRSTKLREFRHG